MRSRSLAAALLSLPLLGCPPGAPAPDAQPSAPETARPRPQAPAEDVARAARAGDGFAIDLYRKLAEGEGDRFCSPLSVSAALGMTWAGARGTTSDEMGAVLKADGPPERFHAGLGALVAELSSLPDVELAAANRLFAEDDLALLPAYLDVVGQRYGAEVGRVDWSGDTDAAREAVNDWVAAQTRDRIRDLLQPGDVDAMTRLVLANAIYFKGAWAEAFEASATRPAPFTLASGQAVQAPFMNRKGGYRVSDGEGVTAIELPYVGQRLGFVALVPERADGLRALEERLTPGLLQGLLESLQEEEVALAMPRFRIEARAQLRDALQALGMRAAFDPAAADLTGMRAEDDLYVSRVIHQAFVEVTEEGTEAAASTAVVVELRGMPAPPREVRLDRPFLFLIRDRTTGAILFMGRLSDPL